MKKQAQGTFTSTSWDEQPFSEVEGSGKLTHTRVTNVFEGDITGETTLQYLMTYRGDDFASFTGLERVVGQIDGRSGSFVLQQSGTWEGGVVRADWTVVPGSGTGELATLRGQGGFTWDGQHDQAGSYTLEYELDD